MENNFPVWTLITSAVNYTNEMEKYFRFYQCCGSGMFIPDPGSWFSPSRIPDPKIATKERGGKNFVIKLFSVATFFTKLNIILFLKCWRKKFGPNFKELLKFLPKKLSLSSQKYGFGIRDPRSGIRKKPIPDPGSRGQKGTGSRIRIRNTGFYRAK